MNAIEKLLNIQDGDWSPELGFPMFPWRGSAPTYGDLRNARAEYQQVQEALRENQRNRNRIK